MWDIVSAVIGSLLLAQFIDGRIAFALGLFSVIAFRLWRRRSALKAVQKLGLSPEQATAIHADLQRGDRQAAIRQIEAVQEARRDQIKSATGIDVQTITPEIGRHISWSDIVRHVFRVKDFDRAGTIIGEDGQVRALSRVTPYGYLIVESPILNQPVKLPITHRDDFLLATSVFDDPNLTAAVTENELLVTYAPERTLPGGKSGSLLHVLHYVIVPSGTLDRYYAFEDDLHMRRPAPEKLFGPFVYRGELRVGVEHGTTL